MKRSISFLVTSKPSTVIFLRFEFDVYGQIISKSYTLTFISTAL